ncbi:LacI family DNA-binding transcriptional regulator [Streptomyces litchfieldiae]|uniref:LacI family DNA-binding transcriptional regulator n=1 Tax=Streptomyces litchfieldiae TaxID=3075543 RepID=A0ABU2MNK4_9ACTN|nr:LacI family DNA-binding transcriptional regulator [Streptomyces sp. DSM 44938]MDT0342972.1 LacI family DNA-binding transcriptional regulator [Streptomyces sp. DSM 44938]
MTGRVSMADVARSAGVSQKTVSRVVNGEPHVSPALRERVLREIERLGFQPDETARALVTRRSRRIGIVTTRISYFGPASLLRDLEHAARAAGYFVSIVHADADDEAEAEHSVRHLLRQGVDGIAVSSPVGLVDPATLVPAGLPLLLMRYPEDPFPSTPAGDRVVVVGNDDVGGARQATAYLLGLGHRTVHHIAGPPGWPVTAQRIRGWRDALRAAGVAETPVRHGDWSAASGFRAARELLDETGERPPTALFVANDQMAIGVLHAIERAGRRVPDDISVIGFDDIPEAAYLSVPLSTLRQDFAEMARQGMRRLISAIDGSPGPTPGARIPTELVVRASTAAPPGRTTQASRASEERR